MKKRNLTVLTVAALSITAVGAIALSTGELGGKPMGAQDQVQRNLVGYATVGDTLLNLHDDGLDRQITFTESSFELKGDIQKINKISFTFSSTETVYEYRGMYINNRSSSYNPIWGKSIRSNGEDGVFSVEEEKPYRIKANAIGNTKFESVEITYDCIDKNENNRNKYSNEGDLGIYWLREDADSYVFNNEDARFLNDATSPKVNYFLNTKNGERYQFKDNVTNDMVTVNYRSSGYGALNCDEDKEVLLSYDKDANKLTRFDYYPKFYVDITNLLSYDEKVSETYLQFKVGNNSYIDVLGTRLPLNNKILVFETPTITDTCFSEIRFSGHNANGKEVLFSWDTRIWGSNYLKASKSGTRTVELRDGPMFTE